ncbi:MAG: YaiI/YqxD family protein [Spirochaeta sp.]
MSQVVHVQTVYLDADSLPARVRETVYRRGIKGDVEVVVVANRMIPHPQNPGICMVQVAEGEGVADRYISEHVEPCDLVITRDIPLAYDLARRGIRVINDRGIWFDEDTARERVSVRNFAYDLRSSGIDPGRNGSFSARDLHAFAAVFDQALARPFTA